MRKCPKVNVCAHVGFTMCGGKRSERIESEFESQGMNLDDEKLRIKAISLG